MAQLNQTKTRRQIKEEHYLVPENGDTGKQLL
jgi:hypothetical protein